MTEEIKEKASWEVEYEELYEDMDTVPFLTMRLPIKNFISQALQKRDEEIIEIIKNSNPEYGELGAAIPDFKERLISTLTTK